MQYFDESKMKKKYNSFHVLKFAIIREFKNKILKRRKMRILKVRPTWYAASLMNCLAGSCHIAGTVMIQRMSSLVTFDPAWSLISSRARNRKKLSACANTVRARTRCPFAADISVFTSRSYTRNITMV